MKVLNLFMALLPLAANAAPVSEDAAGFSDILTRATETCTIINADVVNCRAHATTSSLIVRTFTRGQQPAFRCYADGDDIFGNTYDNFRSGFFWFISILSRGFWHLTSFRSWDFATNWNCFVSGYYTSAVCSRGKRRFLASLSYSPWH